MSRPLDHPGRWRPLDQPRHHRHCHHHTHCPHHDDDAGNLAGETALGVLLAVGALAVWLLRHPPVMVIVATLAGLARATGLWG